MNEYICPQCKEKSYSAANYESLLHKNCQKCGAVVIPSTPTEDKLCSGEMTLFQLLEITSIDAPICIIDNLRDYPKTEVVYEGVISESYKVEAVVSCFFRVIEKVNVANRFRKTRRSLKDPILYIFLKAEAAE